MGDLPAWLAQSHSRAISRPAWEGVQNQRPPRPMPRQMRPPAQRANDPRLAQSERDRALRQFDRSNIVNVDTYQRQAFGQRNQVAEAANMAAESTGLPAIRRAGSDLTRWGAYTAGTEQGNDDLASGALNLGAGSLGVLGMAGMVPRAPMRGALRPPVTAPEMETPPRITRPPTEIAPNGMPIAPPRPFRNSLRGGSSDLMDAAGMMAPPRPARPPAQAPDAGGGRGGNAYLDDLRAQGFDVETPLYHGSMNDIDGELLPSESGMLAGGVYLTPNRARASKYTERYSDGSRDPSQRGRVYDVAVRGEIVNVADHSNMTPMEVLTSAQERGASGVRWGDTIVIWNKDNVRRLPAAPDVGNGGGGRVVYRGLNRPYDPANSGYYQSFTSSLDDAREYGPNVIAARINPGRNLALDGGGNNFNALSVDQLPADVRSRLHPSVGQSATTDQIAHAAREAGYDSVTVRNVHDNRWGERPARGVEPRTIDFVFDARNISPLDSVPQATRQGATDRVHMSDSDRAMLAELEVVPPLRAHEGSWIGTSPTGQLLEFFDEADAQRALQAGWTVRTAGDHLAQINRRNAPNAPARSNAGPQK